MNVTNFRIDDRLIHGQIVTQWIADSAAKKIIVADDRFSGKTSPTVTWLERMRIWGSPGG